MADVGEKCMQDDKRLNYISWDEQTFRIVTDNQNTSKNNSKIDVKDENCKGVVRFSPTSLQKIIGINFRVDKEVITHLQELGVKGFFFVRKKRIPTILC